MRRQITEARRLVVKVGSALVTNGGQGLDHGFIADCARQIAALHDEAGGWHARLADLELKNLAFHGMSWINGQLKGYAGFSRVRVPFDSRLAMYLDILLPHLLVTLARVLANEARADGDSKRPTGLITPREVEVLSWVRDGKTNDEIAVILGLSMLTVKNHLRHAMKKMVVRTRGQAVAKAIALGFLRAQGAQEIGQLLLRECQAFAQLDRRRAMIEPHNYDVHFRPLSGVMCDVSCEENNSACPLDLP